MNSGIKSANWSSAIGSTIGSATTTSLVCSAGFVFVVGVLLNELSLELIRVLSVLITNLLALVLPSLAKN